MTTFIGQCATQTPPTSQGVSCLLARAGWSRSAFWKPVVPRVEEPLVKESPVEALCVQEPLAEASAAEAIPEVSSADLLVQTRKQVYDLQFLPVGWDGDGAAVPSQASVDLASDWLNSCYALCEDAGVRWPRVNVAAGLEGEVVLEWWGWDRSLILTVHNEEEEKEERVRYHISEHTAGKTQHVHGNAEEARQKLNLIRWLMSEPVPDAFLPDPLLSDTLS